MRLGLCHWGGIAATFIAAASAGASADPAALEFFEKQVRPVLAEHCIPCHGPEKQKGGLRLDHGSFLTKGGESGPVLAPGDAAASRLVTAVGYADVDLQMPPKGKLTEDQIAALSQWITQGAPWPDEPVPGAAAAHTVELDIAGRRAQHWAWQPIQDPPPPEVANAAWPQSPLDRFILNKLEAAGLGPARDADRRTLIRRVYFDLTGLPPAPEAVEAFVADTRPDAYEQVVDGLLASPAYGERWGRHWLDLTRYAETYGHEQDYPVNYAWRYRDYVIRAFNADVPYDQMLREHVAGDLLPEPRMDPATGFNEAVTATGFWFMHQATHAPVDVRLDQAVRIDNQIDVFSKAFLGMTVACARCHDHKFDAISSKDYYALAGYLRSSRQQFAYQDPHGAIHAGTEKIERASERVKRALLEGFDKASGEEAPVSPWMLAAAEVKLGGKPIEEVATAHGFDSGTLARWVDALANQDYVDATNPLHLWWKTCQESSVSKAWFDGAAAWLAVQPAPSGVPAGDVVFETFDEPGSFTRWRATGEAFGGAPTTRDSWAEDHARIELAPPGVAHSGLIDSKLQGTLRSPDFTIEHEGLQYLAAGDRCEIRLVIEGFALRDFNGLLFESTLLPVKHGKDFKWLHQVGGLGKFKGRQAYIELVDPGDGWIAVDEIRFSDAPPQPVPAYETLHALLSPESPDSLSMLASRYDRLVHGAVLAWREGQASNEQLRLLNVLQRERLWSPVLDDRRFARAVDVKDKVADALPQPERVLAMVEGSGQDEYVQVRGNYKTPGPLVKRRFLEVVLGPDQAPVREGSGRLELVERLLSDADPLPARVMVNRLWHHLMGRGIVASVDNFGALGQPPSHPELLDYLASRFKENGWSIKRSIRDIVTSRTYRMSSMAEVPEAEEKDPDNVLLHRMNRRRLEGEAVRDAILAVAGTLDATQFGPSVPAYISPYIEGNRRPEVSGPEDGARRRSIYLEVRRNYLPPFLQAFDMPVPDTTQGRRNVSNVPAQALILMNDPFVTEQAAAWAKQAVAAYPEPRSRMRALYLRAFAREPGEAEMAQLLDYVGTQAGVYVIGKDAAAKDEKVWTDLCHVLFTLKEFIFIG